MMQITKIPSWKDIPFKVFHHRYRGNLDEAIAKYKNRYGHEPDEVLITDDGLIAIASRPAGWVEEQE